MTNRRRRLKYLILPATIAVAMAIGVSAAIPATPKGEGVVYIATGEDFPDALGAAAAAGLAAGPVLLVQPNAVPAPTMNELMRLKPATIILVGGTSAISATVESQLSALPFGVSVRRIAGANRYETAANLSQQTFPITGASSCTLFGFLPSESTVPYTSLDGNRRSVSGSRVFYCELSLPDRSRVTKFTSALKDGDAGTNSNCSLIRVDLIGGTGGAGSGDLTVLGTTPATSGSSGTQIRSTDVNTKPYVDNTRYGYLAVCTVTPDLGVVGVTVDYEVR